MPSSPWFTRFKPSTRADLILYCFCYAGGGVGTYRSWAAGLGRDIEVRAVGLLPVDGRLGPPPAPRIPAVVGAIADAMRADLDVPFAFFGHSMGSLIAFELARLLRRERGVEPVLLIASAGRAPQRRGGDTSYHTLPDDEFIAAIRARWNGIPEAVLREPELLELFLPNLRRDVELFETYEYQADSPLSCPISAWRGTSDAAVTDADMEGWRLQTTGPFLARTFAGGHFFIESATAEVIGAVAAALGAALEAPLGADKSGRAPDAAPGPRDQREESNMSEATIPLDREDIQDWLVTQISRLTEIPEDEIDVERPFTDFGLASADAVQILAALEQRLGVPVPATVAWYHPTILALATHLAPQAASRRHVSVSTLTASKE